ncbi:MAG: TraX family protein, partial [Candidatus Izemoplasmatales bacterium]|nr:TraX family protein [Candidatus Izemoplasmatales bacterium]
TGNTSYFLNTNVFIPLIMGLISLILLWQKKWYFQILILPILVLAYSLPIQYGVYGVLMILVFGLFTNRWLQLALFVLMSLLFIEWPLLEFLDWTARYQGMNQWFSLIAFIPLFFYNGKPGRYNKWFFYLYYPFHIAIIFLIKFIV